MNIRSLKKALPEGSEIEESLPNEMCNAGHITIYAPDGYVWDGVGAGCAVGTYYSDEKGSRPDCIKSLVRDATWGEGARLRDVARDGDC